MWHRRISLTIITIIALFIFLAPNTSNAQYNASRTAFSTSITYQNVENLSASVSLTVYGDAPLSYTLPGLPAYGAGSVHIPSLSGLNKNLGGSGKLTSNRKLASTQVLIPISNTVKTRPLVNSISEGSGTTHIPTVLLNKYQTNTRFSVQNTDTQVNNIWIRFYDKVGYNFFTINKSLGSGRSHQVFLSELSHHDHNFPNPFDGSVVIEAKRSDWSNGKVVSSVMELSTIGDLASAFEGINTGSKKLYVPSALCNYNGNQSSSIAVQNPGITDVKIRIRYIYQDEQGNIQEYLTPISPFISPKEKVSYLTCDYTFSGFNGSAIVENTENSNPLTAITKSYGGGISGASLGLPSGGKSISMPYVRWTEKHWLDGQRQRTYLAVQNIGTTTIPAYKLEVIFYNVNGAVGVYRSTQPLHPGAKFYANPGVFPNKEFGYEPAFGGAAIAVCSEPVNCKIATLARVSTYVNPSTTAAEDYNGIIVIP